MDTLVRVNLVTVPILEKRQSGTKFEIFLSPRPILWIESHPVNAAHVDRTDRPRVRRSNAAVWTHQWKLLMPSWSQRFPQFSRVFHRFSTVKRITARVRNLARARSFACAKGSRHRGHLGPQRLSFVTHPCHAAPPARCAHPCMCRRSRSFGLPARALFDWR